MRRDKSGRLHVAGIEIDPDAQDADPRFTDWLLRQRQIVVHDALLTWTDELRDVPQLVLDHVMFRLERTLGGYRFGLVGEPPAAIASPLDFRGQVSGTSFKDWREAKGSFYVRLDYADVAQWREWIPFLRPAEAGKGALRVWFDFAAAARRASSRTSSSPTSASGSRATCRSSTSTTWPGASRGRPTRAAASSRPRASRSSRAAARLLAPVTFTLAFEEGADGAITGGRASFDRLEVAPLAALAEHLPLPEEWRRDLAVFALRGSVSDGKFTWQGPPDAPTKFSGSGAFARFGIAASAAMPGAEGVSGSFTFDETRGDLKLDGRDIRVTLPRVFAEQVLLDSASGRVGWTRGSEGLRLTFDDIRFATPHTSGSASGSWRARAQGPGILDLKAQLARAEATHLYKYLPLTLDPLVRDWLRSAIKQGTATDVKIVAGRRSRRLPVRRPAEGTVPRDVQGGRRHARLRAEVAAIERDRRRRAVRRRRVERARDACARLRCHGRADASRHSQPRRGAPPADDRRRSRGRDRRVHPLRREQPGRRVDRALHRRRPGDRQREARAQAHASARRKGEGVKVAGDFHLIDNQLRLAGVPALTQVGGHLVFTEATMQSRDLVAEVFGGTVKIAVASGDGRVRMTANGTSNLATLRSEFDSPWLARVAGTAEWQATAVTTTTTTAAATTWVVESNLKGATIDLPAPVGKTAAEIVPVKVERREVAGKSGEDQLVVDYRGMLRVIAHRTLGKDAGTVDRALLLLGPAIARGGAADRPGAWVRGQIADLDLDEWLAFYRKESARSAAPGAAAKAANALELNGVDLEAGRIDVFGRVLHDLKVTALRADADWRLRLAGREVEGTATWRAAAPGLPNGKVTARLARLVPPGPDELHPERSEIDPNEKATNTWPELDIVADAFVTRGHDLGKLELLAQPAGPDWRISRMALTNPAGRIDASGWWRVAREKQATEIDVVVATDDAGAFLERFGYPVAVRNAPTKITGSLAWNGAPNDFDYPSLSGSFKLQTGAGQFTKIDPGIGKLLGVLSLQALPRRITLDFRDVFSEGFAFDDIVGSFQVAQGLMRTTDLRLEGPAASVTITGDIDLGRETQSLDVRVRPALSSTFSAGAAVLFIANPLIGAAVGAGTLLAQKLLDNPLGQMFSYDYRVTGSWSDPLVERVDGRAAGGATATAPGVSNR